MADTIIVDTGCANLSSVVFALERLGEQSFVSDDPVVVSQADRIILPGVGSAVAGMEGVERKGLAEVVRQAEQPVLGICLGLQLMAETSEEGDAPCLGVVPGTVAKLDNSNGTVLPHMGWNTLKHEKEDLLFEGLDSSERFYFVHSYALPMSDFTIASCDYGSWFSAAVRRGNFAGVQFHPERSGKAGAMLLQNFLNTPL